MRSLIILEVGHDETTDGIQELAERLYHDTGVLGVDVIDYTLRVDVPPCFTLGD